VTALIPLVDAAMLAFVALCAGIVLGVALHALLRHNGGTHS
jgi:hypothetical protein